MNSHLSILINDKPVALPDDFSIDIEDQNPVFNDTEMFSYPFSIPLDGNRWLVKNIEDIHAAMKAVNMEHLPTRIHADGLPFRSGTLVMQDDEEITNSLSMNIDASTQSFSELISDLQCRDIPVKDQIIIGEKIGNVRVDIESDPVVKVDVFVTGGKHKHDHTEAHEIRADHVSVSKVLEPQALGFSYPASCNEYTSTSTQHYMGDAQKLSERSYPQNHKVNEPAIASNGNYINTAAAYGETDGAGRAATYCNARICYKHHGLDDDGKTASDVISIKDCTWTNEDLYPYWVLDAKRPQSGICFYVLYFLDCLFAYLGVTFDKKALMEIEDLKHLCFFTTVCSYDTIQHPHHGTYYSETDAEVIAKKKKAGEIKTGYFKSQEHINSWLESRGCGGKINIVKAENKDVQELTLHTPEGTTEHIQVGEVRDDGGKVTGISIEAKISKFNVQANVLNMVANSGNFPDESVSTVISSLESAFGIKFSYDYEQKKVTAYLTRDVLRKSGNEARTFHANIHSMVPMTEKITGVRMRYSAESDAKDQRQNVLDSRRNKNMGYSTDYDYIDYPAPDSGDNSTVYNLDYIDFFHNLSSGDKHCYIDRKTGNAYRVKVNGDATTTADLKPVLFEVGQFKGVEYGDCSDENEDFIHDISVDFTPVPFNDVNYFKEIEAAYGSHEAIDSYNGKKYGVTIADSQPILCAYVDEDMEHEFVEQIINQTISTAFCDFYMQQTLSLVESYDPSDTEDGNSPLQDDSRWGFAVALMRGGGSDATRQSYDYNYDHFGTSKWRTVSGKYALACDSLDMMGNEFDYNGVQEGVGDGERFSLKIRAFKEPSWLSDPKYQNVVLCDNDEVDKNGKVVKKIRSRGLFDTFILPYAYFLLNRKKFMVRCTTTVAQVADIPNHWQEWWNIGGMKCLIDRVNTTIDAKTGMGEVELTVYAL
nr:MAG TPA: hypothetical protein [Caudoviricetes sp.]